MRILMITGYSSQDYMGGAEFQTEIISRGLVNLGHEVTLLLTRSGQMEEYEMKNLNIVKIPGRHFVGNRQHHKHYLKIFREFLPDICYVRVRGELSTLSSICKEIGTKIVSSSSSLMDLSLFLPGFPFQVYPKILISRSTYYHLLSLYSIRTTSAAHICNTKYLANKASHMFPNTQVFTIYNGQPPPSINSDSEALNGTILWVNNFKRFKRPEIFIRLAEKLPQYKFVMVGRQADGHFGKQMDKMIAKKPSNLSYLGPKPIKEVNRIICRSHLLVYTSLPYEGFGNSFIQAWFRGVPTISLGYELDGILEREKIGRTSKSFKDLIIDVDELMQNNSLRQEMGKRAMKYATKNHREDQMVNKFETVFKNLVV